MTLQNPSSFSIIFYGTAPFAVAALQALVETHIPIVAVVTAPDKPAGRGYKLQASAVKKYALEQGLPILQPTSLKDPLFIEEVRNLNPDLGIVVAFRMMPQLLWSLPPLGTINLHASLLPQLRGAAPIQWALIHGLTETGVTVFSLKHEIDTGDILAQRTVSIGTDTTAEELYTTLMEKGAALLAETTQIIAETGTLPVGKPQGNSPQLLPAPKLTKSNTQICWKQSAEQIHNMVRGLSPRPAAHTQLFRSDEPQDGTPIQLIETSLTSSVDSLPSLQVGQLAAVGKSRLVVQTTQGHLEVLQLKPQGKKTLSAADFINGYLRSLPQEVFFFLQ